MSAEREMSSWYLSDTPINNPWRNIDGASQNLLNDQDKVPVIGCLKPGIKKQLFYPRLYSYRKIPAMS